MYQASDRYVTCIVQTLIFCAVTEYFILCGETPTMYKHANQTELNVIVYDEGLTLQTSVNLHYQLS